MSKTPRITMLSLGWLPAAAAAFALAGCNDAPTGGDTPKAQAHDGQAGGHEQGEEGHEGHDHEGHDHEGHEHPAHGPHGGDLVELGQEEYHAEVVHEGGKVTIYLLDGAAKNAVPVEATELMLNLSHDGKPEQFALAASPEPGEGGGKSSKFVSDDAELAKDLDAGVEARLSVTIGGTPYSGQVSHDHDHDQDHAHDHE